MRRVFLIPMLILLVLSSTQAQERGQVQVRRQIEQWVWSQRPEMTARLPLRMQSKVIRQQGNLQK